MSRTIPTSGAKNQPIIFFGTENFSLYSLRALVEAGFNVVAAITKPDSRRGRKQKLVEPAVKKFAVEHKIPVWQPTHLKDIVDKITTITPRPAGVLVSYGKIIPQTIIELFDPGIINVHPSLLPKYRGPSPIEAAIANRDARTGVTIMKLTKEMDAGPIYFQAPYALDFTETQPELYDILGQIGANVLVQKLPQILSGELQPLEQNDAEATYCSLLQKTDSQLALSQLTPGQAEAKIRAHLNYPKSRIQIGPHNVIVTKAHGVMTAKSPLDLECANGAFLSIDELIAPSGKTMSAEDFLRGYKL